jgi:cell wall-associated NlpC family hydrolase
MTHRLRPGLLLALLATLVLAGCASAPGMRQPGVGERIAGSALAQLGRPYLFGGSTPQGFDCSGLVRFAYLGAGITVPRTTIDQFRAARDVKLGKVQPGDLLFFRIDSREVSHVAIYAGDGRFVHAPQTGKAVEMRQLDDAWYRKRLVGAGRLY